MAIDINILSLESSDTTCGAAISQNGVITAEINYFKRNLHDKLLAAIIKRTLEDISLDVNELNAVAVSAGPGSFTGLRISAAIAKGICFESGIKLIPVSNLEAYAFAVRDYAKALCLDKIRSVIHSHSNLIYMQEFNPFDLSAGEIEMLNIKDLSPQKDRKIIYVGSGSLNLNHKCILEKHCEPKASFIAELAQIKYESGLFMHPSTYEPFYFQDFLPKKSTKKLLI